MAELTDKKLKYCDLAKSLNLSIETEKFLGYTKAQLKEKFDLDDTLNNIAGYKWDLLFDDLKKKNPRAKTLTNDEGIQLLKHVAITSFLGIDEDQS